MFWLSAGLLGYFTILNVISVLVFGWDKRMANTGGWRVRESTLLTLAFLGGSIGAKIAQKQFRHKTRKEPFKTTLNLIVLLHFVGLVAMMIPGIRGQVVEIGKAVVSFPSQGDADASTPRMPTRFGPGS